MAFGVRMKITKRQLRRIIKEEKSKLLSEQKPSEMSMHDAAEYYSDELLDARDNLLGLIETLDSSEAVAYIDDVIEELERMKSDIGRIR